MSYPQPPAYQLPKRMKATPQPSPSDTYLASAAEYISKKSFQLNIGLAGQSMNVPFTDHHHAAGDILELYFKPYNLVVSISVLDADAQPKIEWMDPNHPNKRQQWKPYKTGRLKARFLYNHNTNDWCATSTFNPAVKGCPIPQHDHVMAGITPENKSPIWGKEDGVQCPVYYGNAHLAKSPQFRGCITLRKYLSIPRHMVTQHINAGGNCPKSLFTFLQPSAVAMNCAGGCGKNFINAKDWNDHMTNAADKSKWAKEPYLELCHQHRTVYHWLIFEEPSWIKKANGITCVLGIDDAQRRKIKQWRSRDQEERNKKGDDGKPNPLRIQSPTGFIGMEWDELWKKRDAVNKKFYTEHQQLWKAKTLYLHCKSILDQNDNQNGSVPQRALTTTQRDFMLRRVFILSRKKKEWEKKESECQ